jgi:hypothetical protein
MCNLLACKSDTENIDGKVDKKQNIQKISESEKHLQNIAGAHNAKKFLEEAQVKFNLKLTIKQDVFFDGIVSLKTDGSKAKFSGSNIDKTIIKNELESDLDKKLYFLAEIYATGFWYEQENFDKLESEGEEFKKAVYESLISKTNFTIYSHPLTDIVQFIDYKTGISEAPFNKGRLYFDRYITVNRVPVPLNWTFKSGGEIIAEAKISRISYPETF